MRTQTKRILIVTNAPERSTKGNRITAERWAEFLRRSGHQTQIGSHPSDFGGEFDLLIALHATHSADAIASFRNTYPQRDVILCLTGTDIYLDLNGHRGAEAAKQASESIARSNRFVVLEPECLRQLPAETRRKSTVILQSAVPCKAAAPHNHVDDEKLEICVIGHLRDEKDPFLAARAALLLPTESRIQIIHLGAALNDQMRRQAEKAMQSCARYRWIGGQSHAETQSRLAASQAMILSSKTEGAPSVVSEAIVNGIPILATRIPASIGLLGNDYPGLFTVGDAKGLRQLMTRLENESSFAQSLKDAIDKLAPKFAPEVERNALNDLIGLGKSNK